MLVPIQGAAQDSIYVTLGEDSILGVNERTSPVLS